METVLYIDPCRTDGGAWLIDGNGGWHDWCQRKHDITDVKRKQHETLKFFGWDLLQVWHHRIDSCNKQRLGTSKRPIERGCCYRGGQSWVSSTLDLKKKSHTDMTGGQLQSHRQAWSVCGAGLTKPKKWDLTFKISNESQVFSIVRGQILQP